MNVTKVTQIKQTNPNFTNLPNFMGKNSCAAQD